jgi:hypothetical protein
MNLELFPWLRRIPERAGGDPSLTEVLSIAAVDAQLLYAAPSHLVCILSGEGQYVQGSIR